MGKVSDVRGMPGEMVMTRGGTPIAVYPTPKLPAVVSGWIRPEMLGMILSVSVKGWTYVLWSTPLLIGWTSDGNLRRTNQRG